MLGIGGITAPHPHPLISLSLRSQTHRCVLLNFGFKSSKWVFAAHSWTHDDDGNDDSDQDNTSVIPLTAASPTPSTMGAFGKLKAQKLKVLMRRAESMKQKVTKNVHVPPRADPHFHDSVISDTNSNSTASVTQGSAETIVTRAGKDIKSFSSSVKHDKHQMSDHVFRRSGAEGSAPATSSYFSGWANVGLTTKSIHRQHKFSAENDFFSRKSFRDLGCSEFMIESLKGQGFLRPSPIQAMSFTPVIEGKSCVIADQSGSGKTLAYLVPIIQRLRLEELQGLGESFPQSPQILIMVPTAELASQVLYNCRSMSKFGVPFRSMAVTGGFSQRTQLENLEQGVNVLIATPGRFMFLVKEGFLKLSNLKCAVLDEVDVLFNDEEFEVALKSLMNASPVRSQYLFVTATLPVGVYNKLIEIFPDCGVVMGPGMHRTSARLEEVLVDCSGEIGADRTPETAFLNKKSALLQVVEQRPVLKSIVFCNKIETCRKVENVLKRFDRKGTRIRVLPFHSAMAQESRLANMKEFTKPHSGKYSLFLVCTDRASRGIDFVGVDHVILFDFPRDPSEYVRRVGRTARGANGKGKAFIFVVGKQVSLAQKIMERNQKGHPLHDVPSAYELMS
ncbi:DEAD-box ATP-dependent RNA helicase 50 isoform X2 [Ricinus communis]|uniref:DEAD-box ATP-dependent RNA helicase 50 isoform X2 n=1 Tax=Ricinus communis TaxID=3988 RepID=UPI00201AA3B9|nr:DEAD-box ATP-dependent RNA helicase 50 isoform X2 [Ricinus communis]